MNVPPLPIQVPSDLQSGATSLRHAERNLELLESIEASGSISRAAKRIRLSYKNAWDCVDAMNNLSQAPLLDYSAESGTHLTEYGRRLLEAWHQLREAPPSAEPLEAGEIQRQLRALSLRTSARNQYRGRITHIERNAIEGCVTLDIGEGVTLQATLPGDSLEEMQLHEGTMAMALIKADFVMLSPDPAVRISARNRLHGKLLSLIPGAVRSEVKLRLSPGRTLTALVTNASVAELGLGTGQDCTALIKASHVIVAAE
ncbi:TOBE domain-containing protein [Stutzerimonas stutzeri]|uniref:TOBE domain-containing protein n=1 Tax=Stutzerimonas stutzeri TaxID=316 RepID=UPI0022437AF5|nr:TOBE domain-containing protein [Stutzerimonas stutzeri]MCW8159468.1 LysR family transcriptional regulator [Stutzerimonas stutzeri]